MGDVNAGRPFLINKRRDVSPEHIGNGQRHVCRFWKRKRNRRAWIERVWIVLRECKCCRHDLGRTINACRRIAGVREEECNPEGLIQICVLSIKTREVRILSDTSDVLEPAHIVLPGKFLCQVRIMKSAVRVFLVSLVEIGFDENKNQSGMSVRMHIGRARPPCARRGQINDNPVSLGFMRYDGDGGSALPARARGIRRGPPVKRL
jgi:hypothetical protein